jgi:hypothetical protein
MELAIPGVALGLLYVVTNQNKKKENFTNNTNELPNTNIPNRNYPDEYPIVSTETDQTSALSTTNRFDNAGGVYTDKYFNPTSVNNIVNSFSPTDNSQRNFYSLTGEKVDSNYFQHNNMVPFFGSNIRSRHVDNNSNESVLDNYIGSGSQTIIKKETAPLFAPSENQQWAHGAPNMTDFYQSRVNPSMKMANVKPFADEKVAPGLGLGYTTQGADGFNSGMMMRETWLPKTADELRVDNKPKAGGLMMVGHEGPANSYIKNISTYEQMGRMEKNRPERAFEMGQDRLFTTTGAEKGQTLQGIPTTFYKDTARQHTTTDYVGVAGFQNSSEYVTGEYMPSHNQQLGEVPFAVANANGRNYATDADFEIKAKRAYPNNRSANHQESYFGLVSGSLGAAVSPLLDALRPTRKSNVIGTLRPYQNPSTVVKESYIFNPADRPAPTIRETTENSKFHMNVDRNQRGGAYETTAHQPIDNNRITTGDFYYAGVAGAGDRTRQMKSYEAQYNQRNNDIKSSTIEGRMVPGNMSLMNGNINMRQVSRDDYLKNDRPVTATMPYQSADVANMGQLQGHNNLYQGIQMDRNNSDILDALKGNPYVVNYKNAL